MNSVVIFKHIGEFEDMRKCEELVTLFLKK